MKEIIKIITDIGTRQNKTTKLAYKVITDLLLSHNIEFITEKYQVYLPVFKKSYLKADGENIPCLPTGLTSGKINTAGIVTTSLISSKVFLDIPHINFNPKCKIISRANFSFSPSIAVSRDFIEKICKAKIINGKIEVVKEKQEALQILVGNNRNPKNIIFSHFDSIGSGAVDNASGTALMLEMIIKNRDILKDNLLIFDGNEEVSYDKPVYWGRGYRNYEQRYPKQIAGAKKLIVIDCIGYDKTITLSGRIDSKIIKLAFPIKKINKYYSKIKLITSDYDKLMKVYHSDLDQVGLIKDKYMEQALKIVIGEI